MIKKAEIFDLDELSKMATQIYSSKANLLRKEFENKLNQTNCAIFVKILDGKIIGFAECSLRHDYVEGTKTSPVGYFEGVYILPEQRRKGFARELLSACENWAKEKHCSEFASDCQFCNTNSQLFHKHVGFEEANRIVCFTKKLK